MSAHAAQDAATSRAPTRKSEPPARDHEELLVAAHRLRARGWTEAAAFAFFGDMRRETRRVGKRIRRMSDQQLDRRLTGYQAEMANRSHRKPRGDLIELRSAPRWPWRTRT